MPVMDEFKEERASLKQKSLKEKISYFFYYYKWHTLAVIVILIAAVSLIHTIATRKSCVLYVSLLNTAVNDSTEDYLKNFTEYAGFDTKDYETIFDTSMFIDIGGRDDITATSMQKMAIYIGAGQLDVLAATHDIMEYYVDQKIFTDMRLLLSPEQISRYSPYFFYVDQTVVDAVIAANERGEDYNAVFSDPRHPEDMENPVPIGIYLNDCKKLKSNLRFGDEEIIMSVIANSSNTDTAVKFIDYVMQEL